MLRGDTLPSSLFIFRYCEQDESKVVVPGADPGYEGLKWSQSGKYQHYPFLSV